MLAVILAVAASAFGYAPAASDDTQYDWRVFENGQPTSTFLDNLTEEQVRSQNPECDGDDVTCFQAYDDSRTVAHNILIQKD